MSNSNKALRSEPNERRGGWQKIASMPSGEADFLPELHRARLAGAMLSLFGETMSKKNSNKGDAKQTKGDKK